MSTAPREYFTVDLRGLRAALAARAAEHGVTASDFLRGALAVALCDDGSGRTALPPRTTDHPPSSTQIKLSVRLPRLDAHRLAANARAAGLSRGAYLAGLIAGAPAVTPAEHHAALVAALMRSAGELAALSRDLNDLLRLLRAGSVQQALKYRERILALDAEILKHLEVSAAVLSALRPRRRTA